MNLLLDTHIWLWSMLEPSRLAPGVRKELEDPANEIWLSPVSCWEALTLVRKGRLMLDAEPSAWIREALGALNFKEAAMNHEVAIQSCSLDLPHSDPADRFIAATALVYSLTLVTSDERLLKSRSFSSMANR